jgi:hypothetical protein
MRLVITSVHYGDMLDIVLPAWQRIVPSGLLVATSPEDHESQAVAVRHGVPCVVTDAWTCCDEGHVGGPAKFNLGFGVNVALGLRGDLVTPPADGDVCAHVSADCYPFGRWPKGSLDANTVYGFWRHECLTHEDLHAHAGGRVPLAKFPRLKNSGSMPIGYFQMWRHQQGRHLPSYPTAGKTDTQFAKSFPRREMLTSLYFLHMGPINVHANWAGRVVPRWAVA